MEEVETVQLNLEGIIVTLSELPEIYRLSKESGFFVGHILEIPDDCPRPYLELARIALEKLSSLPKDHSSRKEYDLEKVKEGYRLIETGEVGMIPVHRQNF